MMGKIVKELVPPHNLRQPPCNPKSSVTLSQQILSELLKFVSQGPIVCTLSELTNNLTTTTTTSRTVSNHFDTTHHHSHIVAGNTKLIMQHLMQCHTIKRILLLTNKSKQTFRSYSYNR